MLSSLCCLPACLLLLQECLEDHIEKSGFSHTCKTTLEEVIAQRVADFRIDAGLQVGRQGRLTHAESARSACGGWISNLVARATVMWLACAGGTGVSRECPSPQRGKGSQYAAASASEKRHMPTCTAAVCRSGVDWPYIKWEGMGTASAAKHSSYPHTHQFTSVPPPLQEACEADLVSTCSTSLEEMEKDEAKRSSALKCLQQFRDELHSQECRDQVGRGMGALAGRAEVQSCVSADARRCRTCCVERHVPFCMPPPALPSCHHLLPCHRLSLTAVCCLINDTVARCTARWRAPRGTFASTTSWPTPARRTGSSTAAPCSRYVQGLAGDALLQPR